MQERTRQTYNEIAHRYHAKRLDPQDSAWNRHLEMPAMERLVKPLCNGAIALDLGCGTGALTAALRAWGAYPTGVDIAEDMLAIAREEHPELQFHCAETASLPFESDRFDLVASSLVLHYLPDLKPTFQEVRRVVRNGGHFVFSMHHPFRADRNADKSIVVAQPYFNNEAYEWRMCDVSLVSYQHALGDVVNGLLTHGFSLTAIDECRPPEDTESTFADYAFTSQYPSFCAFCARRID